jgi:hypothetical protein
MSYFGGQVAFFGGTAYPAGDNSLHRVGSPSSRSERYDCDSCNSTSLAMLK